MIEMKTKKKYKGDSKNVVKKVLNLMTIERATSKVDHSRAHSNPLILILSLRRQHSTNCHRIRSHKNGTTHLNRNINDS